MSKVVTRYAPSPTGNPHVGNIRTAIFAYLHAKSNKGKFLLRIEDTDRARFVPDAIKYIEESMHWLGLDYDGEKIFQSDRLKVYKNYADELLKKGLAYKCFCSPTRLEELRKEQEKSGTPTGYDKKCRNLSKEEVEELEKKGEAFVLRFAMPEKGEAVWEDLIRGKVKIDYKTQDDFVMIKSDFWPTYNFANVIDDHEMSVTDIIRGEEFIPSTPKHIALYNAFGWTPPKFAHMPHIVGKDRAKLSKRHGDTAILDYKEKGYLPEAMLNFLATLGWTDGTEKEIFSKEELIKKFNVKRIGKSPAVFDVEKLNWINGIYIRETESKKLKSQIESLYPDLKLLKLPNFDKILEVEKTRLVTLLDIDKETDFYIELPKYKPEMLVFKKGTKENTKKGLDAFMIKLGKVKGELSVDKYTDLLMETVKKENLSNGDVFWPVRVALSGQEKSPSPGELLWVMGKDESLKRISVALDKINK